MQMINGKLFSLVVFANNIKPSWAHNENKSVKTEFRCECVSTWHYVNEMVLDNHNIKKMNQ